MPLYEFKCGEGHLFEAMLPMSATTRERPCPQCNAVAKRLVSSPAFNNGNRSIVNAIESAERSAYEPEVVHSLPGANTKRPTPVSHDPRHKALPKP